MVLATIDALDSLNSLKAGKGASIYDDIAAEVAKIPADEVVEVPKAAEPESA